LQIQYRPILFKKARISGLFLFLASFCLIAQISLAGMGMLPASFFLISIACGGISYPVSSILREVVEIADPAFPWPGIGSADFRARELVDRHGTLAPLQGTDIFCSLLKGSPLLLEIGLVIGIQEHDLLSYRYALTENLAFQWQPCAAAFPVFAFCRRTSGSSMVQGTDKNGGIS
jgi:hypothetical protein